MSFEQVKDQEVAVKLLRGILQQGRLPNGLLFWGPEGVGKALTAFEFTKAVNCREGREDACDACLSCRKIAHGNHGDVIRISPAGKMRIIKVEVIEYINEMVAFRPYEGGRRVVIIEEADRMHEAAQNHFLKTLEEPPSQSVFLLLTVHPRHLLPTIRSRCQSVRFGSLREGTITKMLMEQQDLPGEKADAIAALAHGSMSRAVSLITTQRREVVLDIIGRLAAGEDPLMVGELFAAHIQTTRKSIEETVKNQSKSELEDNPEADSAQEKEVLDALITGLIRKELMDYLLLFDAWYRDQLVYSVFKDAGKLFNRDQSEILKAPPIASEKQIMKLESINAAGKYIQRNLNAAKIFRDLFFVLAS